MSSTQNTIESNWLVIWIAALFVLPITLLFGLLKTVFVASGRILRPFRIQVVCKSNAALVMKDTFVGIERMFALVKWNGLSIRRPMAWRLVPVRNRVVRLR